MFAKFAGTVANLYTDELSPGSNRYVRFRFVVELSTPNLVEIWRVKEAWLCSKTSPGVYADIHKIIDGATNPLEILCRQTGQTEEMGSLKRHSSNSYGYFLDGLRFTDLVCSQEAKRMEVMQRAPLVEFGSSSQVAILRSRHVFGSDGFSYEFEFEVNTSFSVASLKIGMTPIVLADGATILFDRVRRFPGSQLEETLSSITQTKDQSSVFKYTGPLGVGVEMSVRTGSDFNDPYRASYVDTNGKAVFDWREADFTPVLNAGTKYRGVIDWRFSYAVEL